MDQVKHCEYFSDELYRSQNMDNAKLCITQSLQNVMAWHLYSICFS